MNKLVILFKSTIRRSTFEMDLTRNLGLLQKMPGVLNIRTSAITGGPMGQPPYHRMVEVFFETFDALDAALTSPEGVTAGKHLMGFGGAHVDILFAEEQSPAAQPFTAETLAAYLKEQAIPAEIVQPGKPTPTVASAAKALGVDNEQIVKSVLFMVDDRPFLALGCGTRRVDSRKLADRLNIAHGQIKLATPEQVLAVTGYKVGTVPPFGFRAGKIPTYMDPDIFKHEMIYAGGGGNDSLLKIRSADLQRFTNAEPLPLLLTLTTPSASPTAASNNAQAAPESGEVDSPQPGSTAAPGPNTEA